MLKTEIKENALWLTPEVDHIDTTNAPAVEAEAFAALNNFTGTAVVLDTRNLNYISSVGLRLVLKIKKKYNDFKVINASLELYNIFEMTGFAEMMTVEKAYEQRSVDGCKIIGEGAKGIVYRTRDDEILKVYKNSDCLDAIKEEKRLATEAMKLKINTAISYDVVKVGDKYATPYELLDCKSLSQAISDDPENLAKYAKIYADLLKQIHSTQVNPEKMPSIKRLPEKWLRGCKGVLSEPAWEKLKALIEATPDIPYMIHGDYHTNNIMLDKEGEPVLIDMDTLSYGHPIFELANTYITYVGIGEYDSENSRAFLGFPKEMAEAVWQNFLPAYLGTDDNAKITEVENKAKMLSYCRIISRSHKYTYPPMVTAAILASAKAHIEELLENIDELTF